MTAARSPPHGGRRARSRRPVLRWPESELRQADHGAARRHSAEARQVWVNGGRGVPHRASPSPPGGLVAVATVWTKTNGRRAQGRTAARRLARIELGPGRLWLRSQQGIGCPASPPRQRVAGPSREGPHCRCSAPMITKPQEPVAGDHHRANRVPRGSGLRPDGHHGVTLAATSMTVPVRPAQGIRTSRRPGDHFGMVDAASTVPP